MEKAVRKKLKQSSNTEEEPLKDGMINNLPDDCLMQIFSHLPIGDLLKAEKVCKRWRTVGQKGWIGVKKLDLSKFKERTPVFWILLPRCGRFLEELIFSLSFEKDKLRNRLLRDMLTHCRSLKKLGIIFWKLSETKCQYLEKLFNQNANLRSVKFFYFSTIPSTMKSRLCEILPIQLTKIDIKRNYWGYGSRHTLPLEILNRFENLVYLKLTDFTIHKHELITLQNLPKLTSLKLDNSNIQKSDINDITLIRNLEKLKLGRCKNMPPDFFTNLTQRCPRLKHLQLSECGQVMGDTITPLSTLPNFQYLDLHRCSLRMLRDGMGTLLNLRNFECTNFGNHRRLNASILALFEVATDIKFVNLCGTTITCKQLKLICSTVEQRGNEIKLQILVDDYIVDEWRKSGVESPLFIVKKKSEFNKKPRKEK